MTGRAPSVDGGQPQLPPDSKRRKPLPWMKIAVGVVCVIALVVGAVFWMKHCDDGTDDGGGATTSVSASSGSGDSTNVSTGTGTTPRERFFKLFKWLLVSKIGNDQDCAELGNVLGIATAGVYSLKTTPNGYRHKCAFDGASDFLAVRATLTEFFGYPAKPSDGQSAAVLADPKKTEVYWNKGDEQPLTLTPIEGGLEIRIRKADE